MGFLSNWGAAVGQNFAGPATAASAAQRSLQWGTLATGANVAGSLIGGIEGLQQGQYAASVMGRNAATARREGQIAETGQKMRTTAAVSSAKAEQAASGIDVNSKSAVAVRDAIQTQGAMDAALIHYKAASEAYADETQAALYKKAGRAALAKGVAGAGLSFLSGASSLSDKWMQYQRSGALNGD